MTDRDPLNEADKRDRYDREGRRWVWCKWCFSWCEFYETGCEHRYAVQHPTIASLCEWRSPLRFAPQPEPDQQGTPTRPSKALPPEIDAALTRALADAWDEGYCARHADDAHATYTDNPYRQEQHRSVLIGHGITPREEQRR